MHPMISKVQGTPYIPLQIFKYHKLIPCKNKDITRASREYIGTFITVDSLTG
jgi:hypothetical protein